MRGTVTFRYMAIAILLIFALYQVFQAGARSSRAQSTSGSVGARVQEEPRPDAGSLDFVDFFDEVDGAAPSNEPRLPQTTQPAQGEENIFAIATAPTGPVEVAGQPPIQHVGPASSSDSRGAFRFEGGSSNEHGVRIPPKSPNQLPVAPDYERENATFVTLCRNSDLWNIISSIRFVEDRFNHQFHYDWVFLNDEEFTDKFKRIISSHVSGNAIFGRIPPEHWSIPDHVDQEKAAEARRKMGEDGIIYGDNLSYRHMCRFESGFFFQNEAMQPYRYYWRVEPDVRLFCDINYDVFKFMRENNKKYGWTISMYEYQATIESLWQTTRDFFEAHSDYIAPNNALGFISDNDGETFNLCHFWSNFEIADMDFWRSKPYMEYFEHLDRSGGFFYERWGDAPVHSIAAAVMMDRNDIHLFEDIGYMHAPYLSCPVDHAVRDKLRCTCPDDITLPDHARNIFTFQGYSCTPHWYRFTGHPKPNGWEEFTYGNENA